MLFVGDSDKIITSTEGGTTRLINSRSAKLLNTFTASDACVFDITLDKFVLLLIFIIIKPGY